MNSKEMFAEAILHFLDPVRAYLDDPDVAEIMVNGPNQIYIEKAGRLELTEARFASEDAVLAVLRCVAQYSGKQIDEYTPILEARLPDGSRIEGVLRPLATGGPYISLRRFFQSRLTLPYLIKSGAISPLAADLLRVMVEGKLNILISGGTGTGKTSLLNLITAFVPEGERVGVIEDSKEVQVQRKHVFQLESRPSSVDTGIEAVTIRELFRASLRMRPDRIIIGEIRGGEALDIIQAMVSGHGGCLGTLHATTPEDALMRLETMAMMSDVQLPLVALRLQIASAVNAIIQVSRERDGRRIITHISEVLGYDATTTQYKLHHVFKRDYSRHEGDAASGELEFSGRAPQFEAVLNSHGCRLPAELRGAARRPTPEGAEHYAR